MWKRKSSEKLAPKKKKLVSRRQYWCRCTIIGREK